MLFRSAGADDLSRAVRSHESIHALVSPADAFQWETILRAVVSHGMMAHLTKDEALDIIKSCEEVRVNVLLGRLLEGMDTGKVLTDRTEAGSAERACRMGTRQALVSIASFYVACYGTAGANAVFRTVRKNCPEWLGL